MESSTTGSAVALGCQPGGQAATEVEAEVERANDCEEQSAGE
ncbi:MAG TPA: hypothetical protein V6D08_08390 [Candidatus Obscuribacterales bacterium]